MSAQIVEFLVGLYFIGASLPGFFDRTPEQGVSKGTIAQFVYGLVLVVLAVLKFALV